MKVGEIDLVKGFMPIHEGNALTKWSQKFSLKGDILEIGTYCGKSTLYIAKGVIKNNRYVYTVDHHLGSEEHQLNEEYFDEEIYDYKKEIINTFPLFIKNMNIFKVKNVVPIVLESSAAAKNWNSPLAMVFIDGSHSLESAMKDFLFWNKKIISGGALVIHDIYEKPEEGGQAPYEVYLHALQNGFSDFERTDTIVCLIKS